MPSEKHENHENHIILKKNMKKTNLRIPINNYEIHENLGIPNRK